MPLEDLTIDMVLEATRRVYRRKEKFSAKDVWYELTGVSRRNRYCKGNAKIISDFYQKNTMKNYVVKLGREFGATMYTMR